MPGEACLVFYWFEIETELGRFFYTADRENSLRPGTDQPVPAALPAR